MYLYWKPWKKINCQSNPTAIQLKTESERFMHSLGKRSKAFNANQEKYDSIEQGKSFVVSD